jgi:trans-aconitate 2-methyltransferase
MPREWNSTEYHRLSQPQVSWGKKVLAGLKLRGNETVLDAGCGTGRLTGDLLEALPHGQVIGVDLSQNMLQSAREYLRQFSSRMSFVAADLQALPFSRVFHGIVSTAAFHWVLDHDLLFTSLYRALRPGGWVHAQCGGGPNLSRLRNRMNELARSVEFVPYLAGYAEPWLFQDADEMNSTLRRAGFIQIETSLEEAPTVIESRQQYVDFVRTVIVRTYLERLPKEWLRSLYMRRLADLAAEDDPPFSLDYWRLNLKAGVPE